MQAESRGPGGRWRMMMMRRMRMGNSDDDADNLVWGKETEREEIIELGASERRKIRYLTTNWKRDENERKFIKKGYQIKIKSPRTAKR